MIITLIVDRTDYNKHIEELRNEWVYGLLEYLGIDTEALSSLDQYDAAEYLMECYIDIIDYPSIGAVQITLDQETVGEWAGPEFVAKEEKDGTIYYEVEVENWSIEDEEIDI